MTKPDTPAQACAQCGAGFHCGQLSGGAPCWCIDFPPLPAALLRPETAEVAETACLCPDCLRAEIEKAPVR